MKSLPAAWARLDRSLSYRLELLGLFALCRVRGVHWAVRYLRNPNPRTSPYVLRHYGADIGPGTTFKRALCLDNVFEDRDSAGNLSHLHLGRNCYVGDGVYLDLADRIVIQDNVVISGHASLITHADCGRSPALSERFPRRTGAVEVGHDVWVGFGATILAGVSLGPYSVIAAGAVVTKSLPGNAVYAGVPARLVRPLDISAAPASPNNLPPSGQAGR